MTPRAIWSLETRRLGQRVLVFDCVDSTNTLAAQLAGDPTNAGTVILANEQRAGRGQHGRSWQCPPGAGVLLSVLLFPPPVLRRPVILTSWAAVAVCETIREVIGLEARIKWPNDVLLKGRKVCGILIEQGQGTVVGIGLNVTQTAASFAAVGLTLAGSLALFTERPLERTEVARRLITCLDREYDFLCQGNLDRLEASWKWRTGLVGHEVVVECGDQTYRGQVRELSWNDLELQLPEGDRLHLRPEMVKHVEPVS
jgi:BirA family biotin operon repressor/biotin-[acetyl-CoA-carboxylase] ligase